MNRPAAVASVLTGLAISLFWTAFINAKTAGGLGLCKALFGRPSLLPAACSPTWAVVDPILVALPLSALVALVVCRATRPMARSHVAYVFGGPKPTD
jgi:SSS family solute:Na+ symporter